MNAYKPSNAKVFYVPLINAILQVFDNVYTMNVLISICHLD